MAADDVTQWLLEEALTAASAHEEAAAAERQAALEEAHAKVKAELGI